MLLRSCAKLLPLQIFERRFVCPDALNLFACKPRNFGAHLLALTQRNVSTARIVLFFFFDACYTRTCSRASPSTTVHTSDGYSHLYQSECGIHFLAVTLDLYTHLRRAINFNQGRLHRTSGIIIAVSLIELLGSTTLSRRAVNKLLTRRPSFSSPLVPPNRDLRPINLSEVFQIGRSVCQ